MLGTTSEKSPKTSFESLDVIKFDEIFQYDLRPQNQSNYIQWGKDKDLNYKKKGINKTK